MLLSFALTIISFTGYIDGHEYVYQYKEIIFSGFPRIKPQQSGQAYNFLLRVQPVGESAILKIDDATRAIFNGEYEDPLQASHEYKDLPSHAEFLTRPFRIYRRNGIVTHFEVTKDEPSFSVNLKRGIASLFNLNFNQVELKPSKEENVLEAESNRHYYEVYEESLLGDCETAYMIEQHPYDRRNNLVLNVTKVRNFHKCTKRPNQVYSVFYGHECGEADHEKSHTLHGNAQYQYSLSGDRHHYVIENIKTESEIAYTPYPLKGQTVSTVIKRSLELIEEKDVSQPILLSDDLVDITSLIYDFDYQKDFREPIDLKMPHYLYHMTGEKVPTNDIRNQMEELVNFYDDENYNKRIRDKDFPSRFVELLRSFSTLGYDEIEDLYITYAEITDQEAAEEQKHHRNLFIDTLVSLGTNPAFLFGKYLIENKKFHSQEAIYFLQQLQFRVKEVSEVLLDNLQELCDHNTVKSDSALHMACVFSLSNIVFDHCVAKYHPEGIKEGKNVCPLDAAVKYFNYILHLYEETEDEKLKYSYVKAAGNIGVKEIIPYLVPYIEGHANFPRLHRESAIWVLKNVARKYPDEVRILLVPLLFNRTENYQLRLAAFIVLLHTKPELYEIEGMARALKHDPDDQVRAFVYSTFKVLSNSTHICDRKISKHARYALRILEDVHREFEEYDKYFSSRYYFGGYDPDYDFGGSTTLSYLASDTGYIPRSIYLGFEEYIGGKSMHTFGFGLKQLGLEKFFDKIFGPEGSFKKKSVFDIFKKRNKRDADEVEKELNEIKGKINIPVHDYDDIQGDIFFKYMGNYISSFQFDDKFFEDFFKDGRFVIPDIFSSYQKIPAFVYQRFMLSVDKTYIIPTESGNLLFFDYKQPIYYYHKNKESSFRIEPAFFLEDREGQSPDYVKGEVDGHFVFDNHLIASMGILTPFDQVIIGAGINRRSTLSLPLNINLDFTIKEKKLKIQWTPVAPHEIYHFKYEPFTFIDSYANSVPQILEKDYLPVKKVHRHEFQRSFFHDIVGFGFDIRAEYENEFNDFGSWVDFFMKKNFIEKFYYLYTNPKFEPYDVDIQLSYPEQDATNEVEIDIDYDFYNNNWIIPHFSDEGFEDYDKQNDDSISPFTTDAIKINIAAHGNRERKLHAVATYSRNLRLQFRKINFYYERNPFSQKETENFKVCGASYLKYPKLIGINVDELETVGVDPIVNTELKVFFGKNCISDQKLKIQGMISRSEETLEMERRREEQDTPEHYNSFSYLYHECMKERDSGIFIINGHCTKYTFLVRILHKYNFHIKHENLSSRFLNATYLLDRILKYMYYTHSDHNEIDVHNPIDEVHIEANFSYKLPVGDIRIQKPHSISNYRKVFVPGYTGFNFAPEGADPMFLYNYCTIEGDDYVYTFDRYEYTLPPPHECWKVMLKDCSPNEYFTVLETKVNHPKYHKALKIFLGNYKIDIFPEDSDMVVNLDGKRLDVPRDGSYVHHEGEDSIPSFYIVHNSDYFHTLHSEKYGLVVEHFGNTITAFISSFYRSKLCGLCGNYNGQKNDESSTTDDCHYANDKEFVYSYIIPSDTCSITRPELICTN